MNLTQMQSRLSRLEATARNADAIAAEAAEFKRSAELHAMLGLPAPVAPQPKAAPRVPTAAQVAQEAAQLAADNAELQNLLAQAGERFQKPVTPAAIAATRPAPSTDLQQLLDQSGWVK